MTVWHVRRLEREEVAEAVRVWGRSRRDAVPWLEARWPHGEEEDLAHFRATYLESCDHWIAVEGTTVLGLLTLRGTRIELLYVDPPHQGRGVGTALLAKARELSPRRLTLFTHQRNEAARRFYERRGFSAVAFGVSPPPENEPDVGYAWDAAEGSGRG